MMPRLSLKRNIKILLIFRLLPVLSKKGATNPPPSVRRRVLKTQGGLVNLIHQWSRFSILALFFCLFSVGQDFSKNNVEKKPVESVKALNVGSYNLLNLFEEKGHIHGKKKSFFSVIEDLSRPIDEPLKTLEALKNEAKIILDNDYDVLSVEEVENLEALSAFSNEFLAGKYDSYLIEGNDPRGIDVGFLVKSTLPFQIEQRTHREETWEDPTQGNKKVRIFSRDLPALIFKLEKKEKPVMVFFGTHFKSKRDRPNDPESRILRQAQVERASQIVKNYEKEFGSELPIFLAGDFNGEIAHEKEFEALHSIASMTDSFDVVSPPLSEQERITHSYFPKDGQPKWAQLDAVLVNQSAGRFITKAKVARYQDNNGQELPIPKSFSDVKKNPSDHYPVEASLDFERLVH